MRKRAYFDSHWGDGWPDAKWLERYFIGPSSSRWRFETRSDDGSLAVQGVDGTEGLKRSQGRIDIDLMIFGKSEYGVLLYYRKSGGGMNDGYFSHGDTAQLRKWVRTLHGTPLSLGLFIPFDLAWKGVKEFIATDGKLPTSIAWISQRDLPPDVFPDP
ncbi:MAG: hypothetical protein ACRECO_13795 [Xanthobacteraceae bacterium]